MIKNTIKIDYLTCEYFDIGSQQVAYILIPLSVDMITIEEISKQYNMNLVIITGMDWNNDLTPWHAPGIKPHDVDFGDQADTFLSCLIHKVILLVESSMTESITNRILLGTSLSGLFAIWAWTKTTIFTAIGSISGSCWYNGFAEWFCKQPIINAQSKIYFSLGDQEAKSKAPRFGKVNQQTLMIVDYLRKNKINVQFEYNPGNHFAPILPRINKALSFLV